jgi:hypothetical protein
MPKEPTKKTALEQSALIRTEVEEIAHKNSPYSPLKTRATASVSNLQEQRKK